MQRDEPAAGSLYLVGTPIGHMGDLSPRASHLLTTVDVIACEDTRHSGQLLSNLQARGRKSPFISTTFVRDCPSFWNFWKKAKALL